MKKLYIKYYKDDYYFIDTQSFTSVLNLKQNEKPLQKIVIACYPDANSETIWLRGNEPYKDCRHFQLRDSHLKALKTFCKNNNIILRIIIR